MQEAEKLSSESASPASKPSRGKRSRSQSLLPKEHGVYAEVFFPLTTGLVMSHGAFAAGLLCLAIVSAFLFHEPLLVLLGRRGKRALEKLGDRARPRAVILGTISLLSGMGGIYLAPPPARWALLSLTPALLLLTVLVLKKQEKTLFGELLVAITLSACLIPVALCGKTFVHHSLQAASVWTVSYVLGTLTVHAVINRKKRDSITLSLVVFFLGLFTILSAVQQFLKQAEIWTAAYLPTALACCAVVGLGVPPKKLMAIGWTMLSANALALTVLVLLF